MLLGREPDEVGVLALAAQPAEHALAVEGAPLGDRAHPVLAAEGEAGRLEQVEGAAGGEEVPRRHGTVEPGGDVVEQLLRSGDVVAAAALDAQPAVGRQQLPRAASSTAGQSARGTQWSAARE